MTFTATVIPSGNATAVEVPKQVVASLGAGARPAVTITINGHSWRSRVAVMNGKSLLGISAASRRASGIAEGDRVQVYVAVDDEPRTVECPPDLSAALDRRKSLRAAFDAMPFGLRRKHVAQIEEAKAPDTRARRIAKLVDTLRDAASSGVKAKRT